MSHSGIDFLMVIVMLGCLTALAFAFMILLFWAIRGRKGKKSRLPSEDEGRMIQEIWDGLGKMEDRIMNLETILLQRGRGEGRFDPEGR